MEVIKTLLGHGSFVDFQDRHGNTPLHVACKDGSAPIVVALCEASCNLDISNKVHVEGRVPRLPPSRPDTFVGFLPWFYYYSNIGEGYCHSHALDVQRTVTFWAVCLLSNLLH